MSRVGKNPVIIPDSVKVSREADGTLLVKGPLGELRYRPEDSVVVEIKENEIIVTRSSDERVPRSMHGLTRSLIQNMVTGVKEAYTKRLEIHGVGYRAQVQGKNKVVLSLGFSHPIEFNLPEGVEIKQDEENKNELIISGIDKQKVGQAAAEIREFRKPEPYKGKGIRYKDEYVRRKAGKTAASKE
jgi:large subunit ribosomal protein L6